MNITFIFDRCRRSCGIWMWFKESNRYFCKIKNFAYGEINERNISYPTPGPHFDVRWDVLSGDLVGSQGRGIVCLKLWWQYLTGASVVLLPGCLSNLGAIRRLWAQTLRLGDLARSCVGHLVGYWDGALGLSSCQLCQPWWHRRLSWQQSPMPPVVAGLALWRLLVLIVDGLVCYGLGGGCRDDMAH